MRKLLLLAVLGMMAFAVACSGSSGTRIGGFPTPTPTPVASGPNVLPVSVNGGPQQNYANGIFASVTICQPGVNSCQQVDDLLVDTGSYGVRIFSSALGITLPDVTATNGDHFAECALFADSAFWGTVKAADVIMSGEETDNIPVQIVGDPSTAIPIACNDASTRVITRADQFGANGILGIGSFREDCGGACALPINDDRNPGMYFTCTSGGQCTQAAADLDQQVQNPVWRFPVDNNGIILSLPAVPGHDAPSVDGGALIFGIGTQANNGLGSATVFALDNSANLLTVFNNQAFSAFLDSGSNGLFFLDSNTTQMPTCSGNLGGFYCPSLARTFSATIQAAGSGTAARNVNFQIANTESLFTNPVNFAFDNLGGPNQDTFDWGLPFFFGRNVYYSIEGQDTPAGNMLYVAF